MNQSIRSFRAFWYLLVIVVLMEQPARGDGERVFSPRDVARIRSVSSASISPDGSRIAYVLSVPRDPYSHGAEGEEFEDGPAWSELHVVGVADGVSRPFVTGEESVGQVEWTPDGKGISFLTKRGKDKERSLYVIPADGGEARRLLAHDTAIESYSWSPDGKSVAFLATRKTAKEKKEIRDKGFVAEVYEEDIEYVRVWVAKLRSEEQADPGGAMAAASIERGHDSEGHGESSGAQPEAGKSKADEERFSKKSGACMFDLPGSASELHWSPDGGRLAVALAPTPLIDDEYMKRKVNVVDAKTGAIVARIENPGKLGAVAWSRDGKYLAMISAEDIHDPAEGRLMVVPANGGELRDVLPGYEGHVEGIGWQDGETVMYVGAEGVTSSFGKVNADGGEAKAIVKSGGHPVFSTMSLSRDGQAGTFVGDGREYPPEVFFMKHGDAAPRRLTDSNPWLSEMRMSRQEVVRYKARDALELEGLLIRPLDEVAGQRYPLIVAVHGGPEAREHDGWLTGYWRPGQVAAARGFAVFHPNYRGSTGRGVAFSKMGQDDEGGKEFDDLVDGVDHLVEMGLVDKAKVGVTGGSYGGFASAWCATALSERFAASVMFVGISDQISKMGTTDIPNEMYLVHARRWPWDDNWERYLKSSPIYHAKMGRTPILIMAGKDDPRVHPSQSLELYRYLKTIRQVPVRLVYFPGEGHGNRKASSKLDYNMRMIQWMEHYLKGPGGEPPPYELDYGLDGAERK